MFPPRHKVCRCPWLHFARWMVFQLRWNCLIVLYQKLLYVIENSLVVRCQEGVTLTFPTRSSSPTNSMDIGTDCLWGVEVDHSRHPLHMETSTTQISGYEYIVFSLFEAINCKLSLLLGFPSMVFDTPIIPLFDYPSKYLTSPLLIDENYDWRL